MIHRTETALRALTASNYAALLNAETRAWIAEDPENRGAGLLVEDPEHWARYDVHDGLQLERYLIQEDIRNLFKELHGFRPNHLDLTGMSLAELHDYLEGLEGEAKDVVDDEMFSSYEDSNHW